MNGLLGDSQVDPRMQPEFRDFARFLRWRGQRLVGFHDCVSGGI